MLKLWILYGVLFFLIIFIEMRCTITFCGKKIDLDNKLKYLLIIGVIVLMSANRTGFDARSYQRFFADVAFNENYNVSDYSYLALFYLINICLKFFPLFSYHVFHAFILLLGWVFLIMPAIKKYCCNTCALISLYTFVGVFAADGMQMKNFIAVNFLVASIVVLINEKKHYLLHFYILLTVAVLFHFSFIVYAFIPLIYIRKLEKNRFIFPIIGLIGYFSILTGQFKGMGILISRLSSMIPILSKASKYAYSITGRKSLIPVFIYLTILFILEYSKANNLFPEDKLRYMNKTVTIWNFMGLLLPLLNVANAIYRFYRNIYILVFAFLINIILNKNINIRKRLFVTGITGILGFLIFYHICLINQDIDIYLPVLEGKMFWER